MIEVNKNGTLSVLRVYVATRVSDNSVNLLYYSMPLIKKDLLGEPYLAFR
jgi:hypothetical protein